MRTPLSVALAAALALGAVPLASAQLLGGLMNQDQPQSDAPTDNAGSSPVGSTPDAPSGGTNPLAGLKGGLSGGGNPLGGLTAALNGGDNPLGGATGAAGQNSLPGAGGDSPLGALSNPLQANAPVSGPPEKVGMFSQPFAEPTITVDGEEVATDERCLKRADGTLACKPGGGSVAVLDDDRILYFNALEGTENTQFSIVAEYGREGKSVNDQTRVLTLGDDDNPSWARPTPNDGGANPNGNDSTTLAKGIPGVPDGSLDTADDTTTNDGALFCADLVSLADGRIIAVGGTDYYNELGRKELPAGVVELEGLKNSRIFDPETNEWSQSGSMKFGRWYPTLTTLANGDILVVGGVTKLIKPVYPEDPINSGRNVVQTETYHPESGKWTENGDAAQKSLPLFARMHLLPNGYVYYNAGGQAFSPTGEGYDQPLWNIVSAYNPKTQQWTDLGYAGLPLKLNELGLGALASTLNPTNVNPEQARRQLSDLVGQSLSNPTAAVQQLMDAPIDGRALERAIGSGMRGSTSSTMLPLRPDANGGYHVSRFLTAGGVPTYIAATDPGGYLPVSSSRIDTVTTNGDEMTYESRLTGPLNQPRWYGSTVVLPDGSVMIFNGGTRDAVVLPGLEGAINQSERFDPETETWTPMASDNRDRTYHNTAVLLRDGRVLLGGHSPINTGYLSNINFKDYGLANYAGRDPSFEIYTPPYALRDDRPVISKSPDKVSANGQAFTMAVDQANVDEVFLVRRKVTTHLVDGDERTVALPIVGNKNGQLTVRMPDNRAVAPAGPYFLFVSKQEEDDIRVPSKGAAVMVVDNSGNDSPLGTQPKPAPAAASDGEKGGLLGGSPNQRSTGGNVSPVLPVTDLGKGVTEVLPTPGQVQNNSGSQAQVLMRALQRAGGYTLKNLRALPATVAGFQDTLGNGGLQDAAPQPDGGDLPAGKPGDARSGAAAGGLGDLLNGGTAGTVPSDSES